MKHVLRRHFLVRDMVEAFEIEVPFVRTEDNWADFFTKPFSSAPAFFRMRAAIMNEPLTHGSGASADALSVNRSSPATSDRGGASESGDSSVSTRRVTFPVGQSAPVRTSPRRRPGRVR